MYRNKLTKRGTDKESTAPEKKERGTYSLPVPLAITGKRTSMAVAPAAPNEGTGPSQRDTRGVITMAISSRKTLARKATAPRTGLTSAISTEDRLYQPKPDATAAISFQLAPGQNRASANP